MPAITQQTVRNCDLSRECYITPAEAAVIVGVSPKTILRRLKSGDVQRGLRQPSPFTVDHASLMNHFRITRSQAC